VVADPHVAVGRAGGWKVPERSRERFATAVSDADAHGVDAVILAGDLTADGRAREFEAVDRLLADVEAPYAAVPGNHDVPKAFDDHDGLPAPAFSRRYGPPDSGGYPYRVEVGPVTLHCVNTASDPDGELANTWGGRVGATARAWLADRLPSAETPVVVLHHNLAALPENPGGKWRNFPLRDARALRGLLATHDVPLAVSAHHHVPAVATHGPTAELLAPATCSFPQAWLLLAVGPGGTTVRLVPATDRGGQAEAHRHAREGKPLGQGIARLAGERLSRLPLRDDFEPSGGYPGASTGSF
jgi:hypothetical protein